jgi:hypothetical protein
MAVLSSGQPDRTRSQQLGPKQEVVNSEDCFLSDTYREAEGTEANSANTSEMRRGLKDIAEVTESGKKPGGRILNPEGEVFSKI